jgi:hypothetical protein
MPLRISYKPGIKQSQVAARYFQGAVDGLVSNMIDGLGEHDYPIMAEQGSSLRLRVWCAKPLLEHELNELFEWLLSLRADIQLLHEEPENPQAIATMVAGWLGSRMGGANLFAELAILPPDAPEEGSIEFVLGMVRGRSVVVSTDTLMFTWLEEDIFGMAVAGQGSYLFEVLEDAAQQPLRRAS